MKYILAITTAALLATSAHAVEPGSIFDSPANWTPKTWATACYVCELDRQPQADICHPNFTNTIFPGPFGAERHDSPEQKASLLIRCNACAARACFIENDAATRGR